MFLRKVEIEAIFKWKSLIASTSSTSLDLKPPYLRKMDATQFCPNYKVIEFEKVHLSQRETRERAAYFLCSIRPFKSDIELCIREFSNSLTDREYTWYLNLKPGSMQDWDHMLSNFNTKCYCEETTRQYPSEDLDH